MLGKCMKYEIKAFSRLMLPLLSVFFISWGINILFLNFGITSRDFLSILMSILIFPMMLVSMTCIPLVCIIFAAKRYNDVMFSDKAYLMRPLPINSSSLVLSVFFNSIIWFAISIVVMIAALVLPSLVSDPDGFLKSLNYLMKRLLSEKENWAPALFSMLLSMVFFELMMMLSVTLASRFNGARFGFSFLFFIAFSFLSAMMHGLILGIFNMKYNSNLFFGRTDIVTVIFRSVLSVGMLVYLLWYADKRSDVRQ